MIVIILNITKAPFFNRKLYIFVFFDQFCLFHIHARNCIKYLISSTASVEIEKETFLRQQLKSVLCVCVCVIL